MEAIGDCRHCPGWKGCPGKVWYSYAEIRWCPQHMFWILKHAESLSAGAWPDVGKDLEDDIAGILKREGYFVKATVVIGEVKYRLKFTGWRGRLLAEESINREAMQFLSYDAKSALHYIAGPPKKRKFSLWHANRRYRRQDKIAQKGYIEKC